MDCGNENNRITHNLFLDGREQREAIFIECTKDGVNLIDHNIIWNVEGRFDRNQIKEQKGSAGWYAMTESGEVNGYGIYGEGTDRLRIEHNLIGNCRSAGYFAKPVSFRMHGLERGGTSRDAWILNNLFYRCGEAAVKFPTKDNHCDGNTYVGMEGGYLRILYPEPEVCLHLPSWQEFYQLDREGQEGWFEIEVDTDHLKLEFKKADDRPFGFPGELAKRDIVYNPEEVRTVDIHTLSQSDFYGNALEAGKVIPGPFAEMRKGKVYEIDCRRKER